MRVPVEDNPELPVDLFFYTANKFAASLMVDELNTWVFWSVEAHVGRENCVIAKAERCILDEDERLEAIAQRYGGYFDGYGTSMRGG